MTGYIYKIIKICGNIKNPKKFIYLIFHYLEKKVPYNLSKIIAKKNILYAETITIHTEDCSNQVVHPDIIEYAGKYVMVCTPYPYGMEEYENPSIYYGDDIKNMKSIACNPIDCIEKQKLGHYLSDPCLFVRDDKLVCLYRRTKRIGNNYTNELLVKEAIDINRWSDATVITNNSEESLISPAVVSISSCNYIFYVNINCDACNLVKAILTNDYKIEDRIVVNVVGLEKDYYVWHLGAEKKCISDRYIKMLILARKENTFRLYIGVYDNESNILNIKREINQEVRDIKNYYKSCFIPNTDSLLISYKDKKDVYRIKIGYDESN